MTSSIDLITWCDGVSNNGWAMKGFAKWPYWCFSSAKLYNTTERDGAITFNGTYWSSENGLYISAPKAIIDDFGCLIPVP